MKNKILAIGVPSYNGEIYLDRCINSFVDEELMDRIELIIVNDGSKDRTQEIAEFYQKKYPKMIKVINKENGGHGSAVNAALYSTNAKYYKVVDCDDWVDTKKLKALVNYLEKSNCDLVSNDYETVDMVTGRSNLIKNDDVEYGKEYKFEELDLSKIYMSIHSTTYKTKLLKDHNIKLQEKTFFVDVEYQLLPIPFIKKVVFLDDVVYKYMIGNVNQSVNLDNFVRRYDDHDRVVKRILDFVKNNELNCYQKEYINNIFTKVMYTHYSLGCYYDKDINRGRERSIAFDKYLKENNVEYYEIMGKLYSDLTYLRKNNFVPKQATDSLIKKTKRKLGIIKRVLLTR